MNKNKHLTDAYRFSGFTVSQNIKGVFGDPKARVIQLKRRQKKQIVLSAVILTQVFMTTKADVLETFQVATHVYIWNWKYDASSAGDARK